MEIQQSERVILRLFAGYTIDPPLKYALENSTAWKESRVDLRGELIVVQRQGGDFVGTYISSPTVSLDKLRAIEDQIKSKMVKYCPRYDFTKLKLEIFSQLFIQ